MTKAWDDRTQYGVIIKKIIHAQVKKYGNTKDSHLKIKFATSISNLINTQNGLINDRFNDKGDTEYIKEYVRQQLLEPLKENNYLKKRAKADKLRTSEPWIRNKGLGKT